MTRRHRASTAGRIFVWLWYVPILITLSVGALVSFRADIPATIVDRARVFQDEEEASKSLTPVLAKRYKLSVNLDQTFSLTGTGLTLSGDFRAGDKLSVPLTLRGKAGKVLSLARVELTNGSNAPPIKGFTLGVRSCETEWLLQAGTYLCDGPNEIKLGTSPIEGDTIGIFDAGEELKQNQAQYLLLQIDVEPNIILPVEGYRTPLQVEITALETRVE